MSNTETAGKIQAAPDGVTIKMAGLGNIAVSDHRLCKPRPEVVDLGLDEALRRLEAWDLLGGRAP
jgi:hypothetical protein